MNEPVSANQLGRQPARTCTAPAHWLTMTSDFPDPDNTPSFPRNDVRGGVGFPGGV